MAQTEQEQWVRIFDVPEAKFHGDGFTIYKIVSTLLHRSFPEASTSLEVWRRYSAILKLHREIIKLCNHLQLPENPPVYCKPSMINRFDENEIESRRKYTLILLKYCAKYPPIFTSEQFTKFFKEGGDTKKKRLPFGRTRERKSSSLASSLGVSDSGFSLYAELNENSSSSEEISNKTSEELGVAAQDSQNGSYNVKREPSKEKVASSTEILSSPVTAQLVGTTTSVLYNVCLRNAQHDLLPSASSASSVVSKRETNCSSMRNSSSQQEHSVQSSKDMKSLPIHPIPEGENSLSKQVRTRTTEYIQQRAGQLMARLSLKEVKLGQSRFKSCLGERERSIKSSVSYMKNYRVVGHSDKIIIAVDVTSEETVAIKVVEKSSEGRVKNLILPVCIPFMVPIIRYHETDFAIYLVLKYVSGGKLWNHLKKFIKQPSSAAAAAPFNPTSKSSTYEGQRLIFDVHEKNNIDVAPSLRTQSNFDNDFSEMDPRSFSFSSNFVVDECRSSVENYYTRSNPCDRMHYQSSLSNIIDIPHHRDSLLTSEQQLASSQCSHQRHPISQSKSKSLDDLNSAKSDSSNQKQFDRNRRVSLERRSNSMNEDGSIGSNTLSGVSDDFSCSSFNHLPDADASDQCNSEGETPSNATSAMLSSLPWSKREASECAAYDVTNLIQNSKKLIDDVNKTLERSKKQLIRTFSSSKTRGEEAVESANQNVNESEVGIQSCADRNSCDEKFKFIRPSNASSDDTTSQSKTLFLEAAGEARSVLFADFTQKYVKNVSETYPTQNKNTKPLESQPQCNTSLPNDSPYVDKKTGSILSVTPNDCVPIPLHSVSMSSLFETYPSTSPKGTPQIPEGLVRVWGSQVISAMDYLHKQDIIWGDFNPSNILLDEGGSILVTYKGFLGHDHYFLSNDFKTKEYQDEDWLSSQGYFSPELFNPVSTATQASDWWSVGALLFHLLIGKDVASCHPCGITSHSPINFPLPVSDEAASLISNLLCAHPMERLGSGSSGLQEIKGHPFFHGIEWPT